MATQPAHSIVPASRTDVAEELAVIVQQALAATSASGAAIALREANSREFYCRGSSGPSAPDVGAAVHVEGTFTGTCIESGEELLCDDAETDTRVDKAAARALGIRSMLMIPITEQVNVVGVLAVFSTRPHAFSSAQVATLKVSANRVSAVLRKERAIVVEPAGPLLRPVSTVLRMAIPPIPDDVRERSVFLRCLGAIGAVKAKLAAVRSNKLILIAAAAAVLVAVAVAIVLVKNGNRGSSIPIRAAPHPASDTESNVAPDLSLGDKPPSDLSLLAQPANNVPPAMASSAEFVSARPIYVVEPIYPSLAKTSGVSGAVVLQITVRKDGRVSSPEFIKGPVVFRDAAFNAVKQWVFQPAMLRGQPVEQETRVTLKFVR